jgi:DNA-binding transcriptional ArsR family regulator
MQNTQPNFYAIIPASVRYDKSLSPSAKLLYGEITALAHAEGFCWASNSYFAELYDVSEVSVSHWIKQLSDAGYVRSEVDSTVGNKRKIYIALKENRDTSTKKVNDPLKENFKTSQRKVNDPSLRKVNDITNTDMSNTSTSTDEVILDSSHTSKNLRMRSFDENSGIPDEVIIAGSTRQRFRNGSVSRKPTGAGRLKKASDFSKHPEITNCIEYLKTKLELPVLDLSEAENRRYCHLLMNKFVERDAYPVVKEQKIKDLIDVVASDNYWKYHVTSFQKLFYKSVEIMSSQRHSKFSSVKL